MQLASSKETGEEITVPLLLQVWGRTSAVGSKVDKAIAYILSQNKL